MGLFGSPASAVAPLALMCLLTACGGSTWAALDLASLPGVEAYPDTHGLILEEHCEATYGVEGGTPFHEKTVHRRLRLLTEAGRQWNEYLQIAYDGQLDTLSGVAARIVKPNGKTIEIEAWSDHPATSGSGLHTTTRLRIADLRQVSPGDVIELRWRHRSQDAFLGHRWAFDHNWPTLSSRLVLTLPAGAEVATSFIERGTYSAFEPTREPLPDGGTRLTWSREKQPAAPQTKVYAPPSRARESTLTYSIRKLPGAGVKDGILTSWQDYGVWYAHLLEGTGEVTPRIRSIAEEVLTDAPESARERVAKLYRHVQDTVRYVSIQLGMGGWRPTPADEVAEQGLGDCKDMASYLKTLLATDGIDSDLVVLGTRSAYLADTPGPNLRGHNHVILAVNLPDQPPHFLDATCRVCGYDDLLWGDQGTQVLIADGPESRLVRTPTSAPEKNHQLRDYDITLAADGTATFRMAYEGTGQFAVHGRRTLYNLNQEERERWLRRVPGGHGAVETTATEIGNQGDFDAPLTLRIEGRFGRFAKGSGDLWTLGISSLLSAPIARIGKGRKKLPAHLGWPRSTGATVRITLPDGFRIGSAPEPALVESPYGRYEQTYEVREGQLVITRNFQRTATVVPANEIAKLRAFADAVRAHDRNTAVLTRK